MPELEYGSYTAVMMRNNPELTETVKARYMKMLAEYRAKGKKKPEVNSKRSSVTKNDLLRKIEVIESMR